MLSVCSPSPHKTFISRSSREECWRVRCRRNVLPRMTAEEEVGHAVSPWVHDTDDIERGTFGKY